MSKPRSKSLVGVLRRIELRAQVSVKATQLFHVWFALPFIFIG